jgi:hypothetical protein
LILVAATTWPSTAKTVVPTPACPDGFEWTDADATGAMVSEGLAEASPWFSRSSIAPTERPEVHLRCHAPHMHAVVFGPFRTGAGNWTSMLVPIGEDLLRAGDRIRQFVGDAIGWDGRALDGGQLSVHHLHVRHGNAIHWFETHGDSPMAPNDTEQLGHVSKLPAGSCIVHRGFETRIEAQFANDGSLGGSDGGGVEWFFRVAFWLLPAGEEGGGEGCKPVSKLLFQNPTTESAALDAWHRYNVGNQPALFWWIYRLPRSGSVVANEGNTWKHAHPARYGGLVVVRGRHEDLVPSVASNIRELHNFSTAVLRGGRFKHVRTAIAKLAAQRGEFMCALEPRETDDETYDETDDDDGAFRVAETRRTQSNRHRSECAGVKFEAGEWVTFFAPSEVRMAPATDPFPQHTMLFWIFEDAAHRLGEYVEITPRAYGRWTPERTPLEKSGKRPWYRWEVTEGDGDEVDVEAHELAPLYTLVV